MATTTTRAAHIIPMPRFTLGLRIAQVVLALLVLILVAYSASIWTKAAPGAMDAPYGMNLFTACATFIIIAYILLSEMRFPEFYNMWAVLALEIFLVVFWIISFGMMAGYSSTFSFFCNDWDYDWFKGKRALEKRATCSQGRTAWQTGAAASGIGALEFVLFVITLVVFGLGLHRHRMSTSGAQQYPGGQPGTTTGKFEAAQPMQDMGPVHQPMEQPVPQGGAYQQAPQPGYQQPVYQQQQY